MRKVLKAGDFDAAARLDFEFHQRILLASGNRAMVSCSASASAEVFLESQKLPFIRPERAMETWQEHRKILRALAPSVSATAQKTVQKTYVMQRYARALPCDSRRVLNWAIPKPSVAVATQSEAAS